MTDQTEQLPEWTLMLTAPKNFAEAMTMLMESENQRYEDNDNARNFICDLRDTKNEEISKLQGELADVKNALASLQVGREKLKTENEKLKTENEKLEGGIELCTDLLDQFDEGDILEYASELYGFHDIVEESTPYIDLKEELDIAKTELTEAKTELKESYAGHEKLERDNGALETLKEDAMKALQERVDEGLDAFYEGDILEYVSELYGFHDLVEESTPYIELKEELELTKKEFEKLKRENIPVIRGY